MTEPTNPAPLPAVRTGEVIAPSVFDSMTAFEDAQRVARAIASSALVPQTYRGPEGVPNVLIALDMARRMRAPILAVLQNLNVIHGRPSWSATFIISAISECGMFSPLRFKFEGEGDSRSCYAYAVEHATGETLNGPRVTIAMAKAEGWYGRAGSKWPTMPDVMLTYRAASFFGRIYAASILAGLQTSDEVDDTPARSGNVVDITPRGADGQQGAPVPSDIAAINAETARRPRGRPRNPAPVVDAAPSSSEPADSPAPAESATQSATAAPAPAPEPTPAAPAAPDPFAAAAAAMRPAVPPVARAEVARQTAEAPARDPAWRPPSEGTPLPGVPDGAIVVHDDDPF
jgi:hypothetical protein